MYVGAWVDVDIGVGNEWKRKNKLYKRNREDLKKHQDHWAHREDEGDDSHDVRHHKRLSGGMCGGKR
ncbi:hypothetical protein C0Q70_17054 [Pomacea canaliculata]|uniref:Uncharacterized protein n=1 Tax=Pomacea canaliculata TaxID=400727 RepID=A0A2T7NRH7_POMCA|nr:hypothetical protein C0Q70_17054 [Pomacea canaliculata]